MDSFRTNIEFKEALNIGEAVEREVAEYIVANLYADVEKIGSLENDCQMKPMAWRRSGDVIRKHTSTDLLICKRKVDERICVNAQVKLKNSIVSKDSCTGKQAFYLDQREHTRLSRLNQTRPCALIVVCPDLPTVSAYHPELPTFKSPYVFVWQDDLEPDACQLHRRTLKGKDAFLIPLKMFRSLDELFNDYTAPQPANRNAAPSDEGGRKNNTGRHDGTV